MQIRTRAESAIRHLEMAEARLREEKVAYLYRTNYGYLARLAGMVDRLRATLAWVTPEGADLEGN